MLWAQLDALHHAYVLGGGVPTGAFCPQDARREGRGMTELADEPDHVALPAWVRMRFDTVRGPLGAAGARARAVSLRHLGDDHRAAAAVARRWTQLVDGLAEEFEAPREAISVDVDADAGGLADQGFLAVDAGDAEPLTGPMRGRSPGPSRRWACWPS